MNLKKTLCFLTLVCCSSVSTAKVTTASLEVELGSEIWNYTNINGNKCGDNISQFGLLDSISTNMGIVIGIREGKELLCAQVSYRYSDGSTLMNVGRLKSLGDSYNKGGKIDCLSPANTCLIISSDTQIFADGVRDLKQNFSYFNIDNSATKSKTSNQYSQVKPQSNSPEFARTFDSEANADVIFQSQPCKYSSISTRYPFSFIGVSRLNGSTLLEGCYSIDNTNKKIIIGSQDSGTIEVPFSNIQGRLVDVNSKAPESTESLGFWSGTLKFLQGMSKSWSEIDESDPYTRQRMQKCSTQFGQIVWISCVKGFGPIESTTQPSLKCRKNGQSFICDPM